jgi:hypothetical protein
MVQKRQARIVNVGYISSASSSGYAVAQLVEALLYKAEGCEFDSQSGNFIFQLN